MFIPRSYGGPPKLLSGDLYGYTSCTTFERLDVCFCVTTIGDTQTEPRPDGGGQLLVGSCKFYLSFML